MSPRIAIYLVSFLIAPSAIAAIQPVFDRCRIDEGASLIDFEAQPTGATPSPADIGGVLFGAEALGIVSLTSFPASGTEVEDNAIATLNSGTITSGPYLPMLLTFDSPVAQIGFGIWDLNFMNNRLDAYNVDGDLLGSLIVPPEALGPPGGGTATFIGFVSDSADIARVVFTPISTSEFYAIDNVRFSSDVPAPDSDGDCVVDIADNCVFIANQDQRDSNGDDFGNACDADLDNNCIVNVSDLGLLRLRFFSADEDADFNGDGVVNVTDLGIMRALFFLPPGPSALTDECIFR